MKELTVFEMEQIAAGTEETLLTRIAAAALSGITDAVWGTLRLSGVSSPAVLLAQHQVSPWAGIKPWPSLKKRLTTLRMVSSYLGHNNYYPINKGKTPRVFPLKRFLYRVKLN
ncbi:MAG: hypothetical protein E6596_13920 [Klebsiella grimontii]|nr:hypothetical protein [Klebsiella grimontii]